MRSLQFVYSPPRYIITKLLGPVHSDAFWGPTSCLVYRDSPQPTLPGPRWIRIRTRYSGICGSDLNIITLRQSPALSAWGSFPFTMGHENVGVLQEVGEQVRNIRPGDRVVVDPLLSCEAREVDPPCPGCASGDRSTCRSFSGTGGLSAGILIGGCRDTGGGWSPAFVAHESQIFRVPPHVDDLNAVMAEPFAVALRAVLLNPPRQGDTCLVIGSGAIGVLVAAALRALGHSSRVLALARHPFQAELARRYGADEVIPARGDYRAKVAETLGTNLLRPVLGPPVLEGGAELVFECAGGSRAFADALRLAAPGGRVVLVGLTGVPRNADCSFIWLRELTVRGSFCYGVEGPEGDRIRTFARALNLMAQGLDLSPLVTHRFPLEEYREAFRTVTSKAASGAVRAVFEFPG